MNEIALERTIGEAYGFTIVAGTNFAGPTNAMGAGANNYIAAQAPEASA